MDEDYILATVDELYGTATTTGPQQAWALIKVLENLNQMRELQKFLRLPSAQQELLGMVRRLQDELQELIMQPPPELQQTQELQRLRVLWGLPDVLIKDLQELLQAQEQQEETRTKAEAQEDANIA